MSKKDKQVYSVTSIPLSPDAERSNRMKQYAIAMTIRTICVALLVVLEGWLMWLAAAAAIFLPYFAVVIANAQNESPREVAITPTTLGLPETSSASTSSD